MAGNYVKGGSGNVNWASGLSQSLSGLSRSLLDQDKAKRDEQRLREATEESRQRYMLEYNDQLKQREVAEKRYEEEKAYRRGLDRVQAERQRKLDERAEETHRQNRSIYEQNMANAEKARQVEEDTAAQQEFVQDLSLDSFGNSSTQTDAIDDMDKQRSAVEGRLIEEENALISLVNTVGEDGSFTPYGQELYQKAIDDAKKENPELANRPNALNQLAREAVLQTHEKAKEELKRFSTFKEQMLGKLDQEVAKGREVLSTNNTKTGWYKGNFIKAGIDAAVEAGVPGAKSAEFRQKLAEQAEFLGIPSRGEALEAQKAAIDEEIEIAKNQFETAKDLFETVIDDSKSSKKGASPKGMSPDQINTFASTLGGIDGPRFVGAVDEFMETVETSPELADLKGASKDVIRAALASFVSNENARSFHLNNNAQGMTGGLTTDPERLTEVVDYVRGIVGEVKETGSSKTLKSQLTKSLREYEGRIQALYNQKSNIRLGGFAEGVTSIPSPNDSRFNRANWTTVVDQNRIDQILGEDVEGANKSLGLYKGLRGPEDYKVIPNYKEWKEKRDYALAVAEEQKRINERFNPSKPFNAGANRFSEEFTPLPFPR